MPYIKKSSVQMIMGAISLSVMSAISMPTPGLAATFTLDNSNNNSGTFNFTGVIDTVNITTTGIYTIDAFGAQGGTGGGGLGGRLTANFNLTTGNVLSILVGGRSINSGLGGGFGGGGGTFVVNGTNPLVIAGGGGGNGGDFSTDGGGGGGGFSTNGGDGGFGGGGGGSFGGGGFGGSGGGRGSDGGFGGGGGGGVLGGGGGGNFGGSGSGGSGSNFGGGGGSGSLSLTVGGNGGFGLSANTGTGGFGGYDATQLAANYTVVSNAPVRFGNGSLAISFVSSPTSVPEPFTIIGTLIGGTAAFRMRKKLKAVAG